MSREEAEEEIRGSEMGQYIRHFIKFNDHQAISVQKSDSQTGFAFEYQERESEKDQNNQKVKRGKGRPKKGEGKKQGILKEQKIDKNNEDNGGNFPMDSDLSLEELTKTVKRKRGRPSKKESNRFQAVKKFYAEQNSNQEEEENRSKTIEKRKRGRPPKAKQQPPKAAAAKPKIIAKTDQVEPQAKKRLLKRIRDKLAGREEQQVEVVIDVEDHERKKANVDPYPNSLKTITIKPRQSLEILQIKRKEDGLTYLVQIEDIIKWATKQDLVEDFALEVIGFFQNRLIGQQNEPKIKEKSNLYVRYQ